MSDDSEPEIDPKEHHIWCSRSYRPVEECKLCKRLFEQYPYGSREDARDLAAKHFPEAVEIPGTASLGWLNEKK